MTEKGMLENVTEAKMGKKIKQKSYPCFPGLVLQNKIRQNNLATVNSKNHQNVFRVSMRNYDNQEGKGGRDNGGGGEGESRSMSVT